MINTKPFEKLMRSEGGLNKKEPKSVGGVSYAGITKKAYDAWKKNKCQIVDAPSNVEDLAGTALGTQYEKSSPLEIPEEYNVRVDVITAFYEAYFEKAYVEMLPVCIQYMHMDFFTNAYSHANKVIQKILGFEGKDVDGILGRGSRAQLEIFTVDFEQELENNPYVDNDLIEKYHELKLQHYESLKDTNRDLYEENIRGWKKRANHVLADLQEYFDDPEPTTSAIPEDEVIDIFEEEEVIEEPKIASEKQEELEQRIDSLEEKLAGLAETIEGFINNFKSPKKSFFN